jgi:TPR repeat protein
MICRSPSGRERTTPGGRKISDMTTICCAECSKEGGASLKICKACMLVKYCNAACQHKHWAKHKAACKQRVAELRDEALFKDPPPMEDCPICFLPMADKLISCVTLPPATVFSVPIYDFAKANEELAKRDMETYYPCCGKNICRGCVYSFWESGNIDKCPFCNSDRSSKTVEENNEDLMKRVAANDAASICLLANDYQHGLIKDQTKAMELYARAAELGFSQAHNNLAGVYHEGGDMKKAKFHYETAAMAGHEVSRCIVGHMEAHSGNMERAVKHWNIAASAGDYLAMYHLRIAFEKGLVSRDSINSTLAAYNSSCTEMSSKPRDACLRAFLE